MQLYHSPTTPFGRKVMVLLHETGLLERVTVIEGSGTPLAPNPDVLAVNPLGKIPALQTGDGTILFDSRVICRYLDDLAQAGLYGQGDALWRVLTLEATADGILDAALLMTYEARLRPEALRFPDWVEGQWGKIARALDHVEAQAMGQLAGPLDMGQIALACALAYVDFRHGARNWREGRPSLAAWESGFARRAAMQATKPPAA